MKTFIEDFISGRKPSEKSREELRSKLRLVTRQLLAVFDNEKPREELDEWVNRQADEYEALLNWVSNKETEPKERN